MNASPDVQVQSHCTVTFEELVEYGRRQLQPEQLVGGMPWHFKFQGWPVTHENDQCYLILNGSVTLQVQPGDLLTASTEEVELQKGGARS